MLRISIILQILFFSISYPQSEWTKFNGPYGGHIASIKQDNLANDWITSRSGLYKYSSLNEELHKVANGVCNDLGYDSFGNIYLVANKNLYKSTDQGNSWSTVYNGNQNGILKILVAKNDYIFLGKWEQDGMLRSTDFGNTWEYINNGLLYRTINSIVEDSAHNLYVAAWNTTIYEGKAIYKSTNNGATWVCVKQTSQYIYCLFADNLGNIYAGLTNGIIKSTDQGVTWNLFGLQDLRVTTIEIDESNNIYAGSLNQSDKDPKVFKHADNSLWTQIFPEIGTSYLNYSISSLKKISQNAMLIGTTGDGVYYYNLLNNSSFPLGCDVEVRNLFSGNNLELLAGPQNGTFKYDKSSTRWIELTSLTGEIFENSLSNLFINYDFKSYKSSDNGTNWLKINDNEIRIIDPFDNMFVLANSIVYMSTDYGLTWESRGVIPIYNDITFYSIDSTILLNTNTYDLWRTKDKCLTWQSYTFTNAPPYKFCTTSASEIIGFAGGDMYKSSDKGVTWQYIQNLGMIWPYCLTVDKNDNIYIGTENGVIKLSADTYISSIEGLHDCIIHSMTINDNNLIAGTDKGVFYKAVPITDSGNQYQLINFELYQNYPNPFNTTTKIKFSIPKLEMIQIKVFDFLGKEIKTILKEYKQAGINVVDFDASNLPSGVYFYRLIGGSYSETKKMILLK